MKAFIFDMDGVIIDSEPLHAKMKLQTFHDFGLPMDEADCARYVGMTSRTMFQDVIAKSGKAIDLEKMIEHKQEMYLDALCRDDAIRPIDGVMELIRNLKRLKVKIALASSSNRRSIDAVMRRFGLKEYFSSILSGGDLPKSKPDPAVYLLSAQRLGVLPKECVVLEDAAAGVLAAKRAGMYVIAYRNPNSGNQDLRLADEIVDSIRALKVERFFRP